MEKGSNSMHNVAAEYKEKIANAKLNAIYRHMSRGGGSDAVVEIQDYDIKYFTKKIKILKEQRKNRNGVIKTYVYGIDKNTGKRINKSRIVRKSDKDEFQ